MASVRELPAGKKPRLTERERKIARLTERESLRGLLRDVHITEEDIAEARREVWGSFPREDV